MQEKLIAVNIVIQAVTDYRNSNSSVKDFDVEYYIESDEFKLHCAVLELNHNELKKKIKACKNSNKKSKYISIKVMSLYFDFNYEEAYWWCFRNRLISFSEKRMTPRVTFKQARLLLDHMRGKDE